MKLNKTAPLKEKVVVFFLIIFLIPFEVSLYDFFEYLCAVHTNFGHTSRSVFFAVLNIAAYIITHTTKDETKKTDNQ